MFVGCLHKKILIVVIRKVYSVQALHHVYFCHFLRTFDSISKNKLTALIAWYKEHGLVVRVKVQGDE